MERSAPDKIPLRLSDVDHPYRKAEAAAADLEKCLFTCYHAFSMILQL